MAVLNTVRESESGINSLSFHHLSHLFSSSQVCLNPSGKGVYNNQQVFEIPGGFRQIGKVNLTIFKWGMFLCIVPPSRLGCVLSWGYF